MAWAAADTPGTVCDWRNEILEFVVPTLAPALLMIGLLGGIGGGTRELLAAPKPFFTGGWGGWFDDCCTLWARIIVATLDPADIALVLSCLKTWPGDIDLAIPVAKREFKLIGQEGRKRIYNLTWTWYWNTRDSCCRLDYFRYAAHHGIRTCA